MRLPIWPVSSSGRVPLVCSNKICFLRYGSVRGEGEGEAGGVSHTNQDKNKPQSLIIHRTAGDSAAGGTQWVLLLFFSILSAIPFARFLGRRTRRKPSLAGFHPDAVLSPPCGADQTRSPLEPARHGVFSKSRCCSRWKAERE